VCPLASAKFHGFQCAPAPLVRIDAGAGDDHIDASRVSTPLHVDLGPGSDVLIAGAGNDAIAATADGVRDVVDCGAGQDVVDGVADPNDDIAGDCESASRSFAASMLRNSVTVAPPSTLTLAIGKANVPLSFAATLTTAPPKHGKHAKARTLAHTTVPQGTGPGAAALQAPQGEQGVPQQAPQHPRAGQRHRDRRRRPALSAEPAFAGARAAAPADHPVRQPVPPRDPARLRHPHGG